MLRVCKLITSRIFVRSQLYRERDAVQLQPQQGGIAVIKPFWYTEVTENTEKEWDLKVFP